MRSMEREIMRQMELDLLDSWNRAIQTTEESPAEGLGAAEIPFEVAIHGKQLKIILSRSSRIYMGQNVLINHIGNNGPTEASQKMNPMSSKQMMKCTPSGPQVTAMNTILKVRK